jgi:hypothetical protein
VWCLTAHRRAGLLEALLCYSGLCKGHGGLLLNVVQPEQLLRHQPGLLIA